VVVLRCGIHISISSNTGNPTSLLRSCAVSIFLNYNLNVEILLHFAASSSLHAILPLLTTNPSNALRTAHSLFSASGNTKLAGE